MVQSSRSVESGSIDFHDLYISCSTFCRVVILIGFLSVGLLNVIIIQESY